jgi:ABC-type nitrate/sulfonate/bicarbonate transport system substrate-binding protein
MDVSRRRALPRRCAALLGLAAAVLLAGACRSGVNVPATSGTPATGTPKPAHINYVLTSLVFNITPELVAQSKGFFAQENLTVDLPVAGQSASACQQVLAKAADIAQCSLNDMIQADEAGGAHLVMVMNESATALQYGAMAKPNITSWNDVRGKTVMVGGPKDNTVYYFHIMARAHGLKDTDYNFQYAGASSARLAALKSGGVDIAMLANPADIQGEQEGFHRLDNLLPQYLNADNYAGGGPVVTQEWAKSHSDELSRYLRAILKSINWIYDPANEEALFEIVGPKLNLTRDVFEQTYQVNVVSTKTWSTDGQIKDNAIQGVLKGLVDLGALKEPIPPASKYYDRAYLDAALKPTAR